MQFTRKGKQLAASAMIVASAGLVAGTVVTADAAGNSSALQLQGSGTETHARLGALNNSGVTGRSDVTVSGRTVKVSLDGFHLMKGVPHAMHIHFAKAAEHECPTVRDDKDADHRLTTSEGVSSYGVVKASLTTRGDTSPASALAVNRFPTAPKHQIHYDRSFHVGKALARAIKRGKAVLVIHGIDYNQNGKYDFSAGKSDLDPNLPAEATDPVACGVLHTVNSGPLG